MNNFFIFLVVGVLSSVMMIILLITTSSSSTANAAKLQHHDSNNKNNKNFHHQDFQQFRSKKIHKNSPYNLNEEEKKSINVYDSFQNDEKIVINKQNLNNNKPFYSSSSPRNKHHTQKPKTNKKSLVGKHGGEASSSDSDTSSSDVGDTPWSWSGSSWSFSSASASSSSSSSSSGSYPTPMPPPPPEPTPSPGGTGTPYPTPLPPPPPEPTPSPGGGSSSSFSSSSAEGNTHLFTIYNNCTERIWVAILGNPGFPVIMNGGFVMAEAGPPQIVPIPFGWQGRMWARIGCEFNSTGYCNPPYQPCCASGSCLQADGTFGMYCAHSGISPTSLIEVSLDNPSPFGPYDDYDVSLVDGWSVPLSINPVAGSYNPLPDPGVQTPWCQFSGCYASPACPTPFAVNGTTLSCFSPCQAAVRGGDDSHHEIDKACCVCTQSRPLCDCNSSNTPSSEYYGCCQGSFGCTPYHTPSYPADEVCNPWAGGARGWDTDQLKYISEVEGACNKVYSWQFDDKAASFQCRKTDGVVDYDLMFVTRFRDPEGREDERRRRIKNELEAKEKEIKRLVALRDGKK